MNESPVGDDEINLRARKGRQWRKVFFTGYALAIFGIGFWASRSVRPFNFIISHKVFIISHMAVVLPFALLFLVLLPFIAWITNPPNPDKRSEEQKAVREADRLQYARRRTIFLYSAVTALMTAAVVDSILVGTNDIGQRRIYPQIFTWCLYAGICALHLTKFAFRREARAGTEDELICAYRAQAVQTGFWFVLLGCLVAFILGLFNPIWAVAALPGVVGLGIVTAGLQFALLDRRSVPND